MEKMRLEERLKILNGIGNRLSRAASVDDLCRKVVELGRDLLDFDRISIWFVDKDPDFIFGSYGIDENGRLRNELSSRVRVDSDPMIRMLRADKAYSLLRPEVPLRDNAGKAVGRGSHIIAAIWNGEEVVGYLSTDNLITKKGLEEGDRDLLELYAATFGHIYSLKKAEEELRAAYNKLQDVQHHLIQAAKMEVVGGLASGIAHEVKNPLAIILQGVDYLTKKIKEDDETTHMILQRMKGAVKKANGIISGLLDFSVLSKLELTPQNMNSLADKSLELVRHELDRYHIKVVRSYQKDIPDVKIDRNKIEQVFVNLFMNSINHMPDGGELRIRTHSVINDGKDHAVIVELEDTGTGIPKNIVDKIFDPFFTTRRGSGGTGLGLTIVRNIIEMHNGKIEIENRKNNHGARAILTFRAQRGKR